MRAGHAAALILLALLLFGVYHVVVQRQSQPKPAGQ